MSAIEIVKAFYDSDMANDPNIVSEFFHEDCEMHWTSSHGFRLLNYNDIKDFFEGTRKSFNSLRFEFTHFLEIDDTVVTRHTLYGGTIESADSEIVLGHFSSIWEIKDSKLYRGYEISQKPDESDKTSMDSYREIKK